MTISRSSVALNNLRAVVIVIVVAFHSVLAYLGWLRSSPFPFDRSPFQWQAFPIIDSHRWFGFDVFCAWQDVYLMALMFFLSALFAWSGLKRKGTPKFLRERFLRLGLPFVFGVAIVMPIALYPVYRMTATDPGVVAYGLHYLALPFLPNGPMWFLWQLLALSGLAAVLHRLAPNGVEFLARLSGTRPARYLLWLVAASVLAYVPLALIFTPWAWVEHGPLGIQFSRPLLYAMLYCAGLGIGAHGLDRGLLAPDGPLIRHWVSWLASALASFMLWIGLTALAMSDGTSAPFGLQLAVDISFAIACVCGCCFAVASCLRFGTMRSRVMDSLAENAFGIYLFHYPFVVWLQYALLPVAWFAIAKAAVVFGGTITLAWATAIAARFVPFGTLVVGAERRLFARTPAAGRNPALESQYASAQRHFPPPRIAGE
jgi:peptidoglycan/LPS O-acetylase OafA/YrhL